jgi:hypothetical protein
MSDPKPFASLGPTLLARKGGAKPAMRPQLLPLQQFNEATARQLEDDDLGWNDMGHDDPADVIPIQPELVQSSPATKPKVVQQQEDVARRIAGPKPVIVRDTVRDNSRARRSALSDGRRAAFTLRVDAERHLKLRLACTIRNRSAQQLVTDALDRLLADLPDIAELAAQVTKRQK